VLEKIETVGAIKAESTVTAAMLDWGEVAPELSLTVAVIE
jgi:hypothetical protein